MDTYFSRIARSVPLSVAQMELVVGSLLGDAMLQPTTCGFCFRVHHGLRQRAWVDWKYLQLQRFVRTGPRASSGGYYFRTVSHPAFTELRSAFYDGRQKIVPLHILEEYLSSLALAVWIMDDGAIEGRQMRINTQSFSRPECDALREILKRKFELEFAVNTDKGKPRLRCRSRSMPRLSDLIVPYLLPEMRYKLPR